MFKRLLSPFSRFSHTIIGLLLLSGLLFLRIPYITIVITLYTSPPEWVYLSYTIGTYILTAMLIWWERKRLQIFWFDLGSALIFLCQKFMFPVGIGLFVAMHRSKARFPAPPSGLLRWTLIGALLAILFEIFITLANLNPPQERGFDPATLAFLFPAVLTQMINAAVWEEPLFRGFLWGYLRLARWQNVWIWLFQAGLFTLSHVYYLREEPVGPWLIRMLIPSLLLGLIAWRASSIVASMIAHGFLNATGDLLMHIGTPDEALRVAWSAAALVAAVLLAVLAFEMMQRQRPGLRAGS
jgi:membrane protease YdiL (CAAX protease family)